MLSAFQRINSKLTTLRLGASSRCRRHAVCGWKRSFASSTSSTSSQPNREPGPATATPETNDKFINGVLAGLVGMTVVGWWCFFPSKYNEGTLLTENECSVKLHADALPGSFSANGGKMKRVKQELRLPLEELEKVGVAHGIMRGTTWRQDDHSYYQQPYWNDEAAYEFSTEAVVSIRDATHELHAMCLQAVELVIGKLSRCLSQIKHTHMMTHHRTLSQFVLL